MGCVCGRSDEGEGEGINGGIDEKESVVSTNYGEHPATDLTFAKKPVIILWDVENVPSHTWKSHGLDLPMVVKILEKAFATLPGRHPCEVKLAVTPFAYPDIEDHHSFVPSIDVLILPRSVNRTQNARYKLATADVALEKAADMFRLYNKVDKGSIVVITGDVDYMKFMDRAVRDGFRVELLSGRNSCQDLRNEWPAHWKTDWDTFLKSWVPWAKDNLEPIREHRNPLHLPLHIPSPIPVSPIPVSPIPVSPIPVSPIPVSPIPIPIPSIHIEDTYTLWLQGYRESCKGRPSLKDILDTNLPLLHGRVSELESLRYIISVNTAKVFTFVRFVSHDDATRALTYFLDLQKRDARLQLNSQFKKLKTRNNKRVI
jgi:NYN domain